MQYQSSVVCQCCFEVVMWVASCLVGGQPYNMSGHQPSEPVSVVRFFGSVYIQGYEVRDCPIL